MNRRTAVRIAGVAISVICLAYFAAKAMAVWHGAETGIHRPPSLGGFTVSLLPYMTAYLLYATMWDVLLRALGCETSVLRSWGIFLTAQFAKYLPGNVGHHAGRVALSIRYGYAGARVAASMILEMLLVAVTAAILSLPLVGWLADHLAPFWERGLSISLFVLAVLAVFLFLYVVLAKRFEFAARMRRWKSLVLGIGFWSKRTLTMMTLCAAISLVAFVLSGMPLVLISDMPTALTASNTAAIVAIFAVSWFAGLIMPGAPAGLGVREAILVEGLTPIMGIDRAVSVTLMFRVLTVFADLLAFGAGLLLLRIAARSERGATA